MNSRLIPCCVSLMLAISFAGAQSYLPTEYAPKENIRLRSTTATTTLGKVRLYLAPTSDDEGGAADYIVERIRKTADQLKRNKVRRKRQSKAVEIIRREVESTYLHHYQGLAGFNDLFKGKQYNELTTAALVSMLLDELLMEHQLLLDRQQPRIVLEDGTALQIDQWGRGKSAASSRREEQSHMKAVLQALQLSPGNALYQQLMSPYRSALEPQKLLPAELTGMLYYRRALHFYTARQFAAALVALERARTYYSDPRLDLVRYAVLYQQVGQVAGDSVLVEPLFELYRLHPTREMAMELVQRFARLAEYYLLEQEDHVAFENRYDDYRRLFAGRQDILRQLKEIYFIEMAQYHAGKQEAHQVMIYLDSLNDYRPEDRQVQAILKPLLLRSLYYQKDPEEGLAVIETYRRNFPFLRQDVLFLDLELSFRAERTRKAFDADREGDGKNSLETFEGLLAQAGLTPRSKLWITTAYTSASAYYFRQADYVNARWLIQRALALIPDDPFLLHRQEVLRNY